jgi:predicted dehydrogenase/threonine dehydrogenase-like Zn-dependent dehydrogenase
MKQVAQRLKDGEIRVVDVPEPQLDEWRVLVRTRASVVSAGTERAKVEVARESLLGKARRRPDQVRQVLDRVRTDGLSSTIDAVRTRLESLSPLGYCSAGLVERVGAHVRDIQPGDWVACGGEAAVHAEVVAVPGNLCCPIPSGVDAASAAFTTLGAIAMHGFRQGEAALGARVAVVGLGLVGQLTARIAHAAGAEVMGIDLEDWRLEMAMRANSVDHTRRRDEVSTDDHTSWDVVLVTAAAPSSNDPVELAVDLARERGRIIIVGDVRLDLDRRALYEKELELRLARSYGPGRYDEEYELRGLDYPLPYVRWTQRRNMAAFLRLLADGRVAVDDLVTHRFPIAQADEALDLLTRQDGRALGVVIEYEGTPAPTEATQASSPHAGPARHGNRVGFIGAGSFARRNLIPLAKQHGLLLDRVATASGLTAASAAEQFDFARGACTPADLLADDAIAAVVIATRHNEHGRLVLDALRAGKTTFVEKPLCLTERELEEIAEELARPESPPLIVGFNRRYAPLTARVRAHLDGPEATNVLIRVNAGPLAPDHWLNDPSVGGGRLLGEGCHFIDLLCALVESRPVSVTAQGRREEGNPANAPEDFAVALSFADGSLASLLYGTAGARDIGKESIEGHRGKRSALIDDFRAITLWGNGRRRRERMRTRDKGHSEEMRLFARVARGEHAPPPAEQALTSMRVTFAALRALETGRAERIPGSEGLGEQVTEA